MKKTHNILILLITFSFLFSSCTDDPVTVIPPPPPPAETLDTYTWEKIYVGGDIWDMYAADSNDIYIQIGWVPVYYNGQSFMTVNLQDPEFGALTVRGYDKNNIFFGGHRSVLGHGCAVLKKMTSGMITSFSFENDSSSDIADILPIGPNEAWLSSSSKNNIYLFNNGGYTLYKLDSGAVSGRFFKDIFNNLYVFALSFVNSTDLMYSYRFEGSHFQLIAVDTIEPPSEKSWYLHPCGKDILMCEPSPSVFWFNGLEWTKILTTNGFYIFNVGGRSKDTLVAFVFQDLGTRLGYYTVKIWDGPQWKTEKNFPVFTQGNADWGNAPVYFIDDKVIFTVSINHGPESYLIIGRKNKKSQLRSNMPKLNIQSL